MTSNGKTKLNGWLKITVSFISIAVLLITMTRCWANLENKVENLDKTTTSLKMDIISCNNSQKEYKKSLDKMERRQIVIMLKLGIKEEDIPK